MLVLSHLPPGLGQLLEQNCTVSAWWGVQSPPTPLSWSLEFVLKKSEHYIKDTPLQSYKHIFAFFKLVRTCFSQPWLTMFLLQKWLLTAVSAEWYWLVTKHVTWCRPFATSSGANGSMDITKRLSAGHGPRWGPVQVDFPSPTNPQTNSDNNFVVGRDVLLMSTCEVDSPPWMSQSLFRQEGLTQNQHF